MLTLLQDFSFLNHRVFQKYVFSQFVITAGLAYKFKTRSQYNKKVFSLKSIFSPRGNKIL